MSASNPAMFAAGIAMSQANGVQGSAGILVEVDTYPFEQIVQVQPEPFVVVRPKSGIFQPVHRYVTPYRGCTFFTKTPEQLSLPREVQLVYAKKLHTPGLYVF